MIFRTLLCACALASATCPEGIPIAGVRFSGLQNTQPLVVQRELRQPLGTPFRSALWIQERDALLDLDLFASVELSCDTLTQGGHPSVHLHYQFLEIFQYLPAPAGKQTDQDGWMLGGAFAALNLFGYDIRTELQLRTTVTPFLKAKEYALYASSPWFGRVPLSWRGELVQVDSRDDLRGFIDRSLNADLDLEWKGHRRSGLLLNGGFRRIPHAPADSGREWLSNTGQDYVPHLGFAWIWDNRNTRLDTRRGLYQEVRMSQFGGWLGGVAHFQEYLSDTRWAFPFAQGTLRTNQLLRYRPGSIAFYDRLQQGGANTLRGYGPDSSRHGNSELLANVEYRHPLVQRKPIQFWGVQGFWGLQMVFGWDVAYLWDATHPLQTDSPHQAAYVGIHLVLPAIDRLRIELGGNPHDKSWDLQISLFEKVTTQRWRSR